MSDRTGTTALRARNAGVDVMQIQKVLEKNPELADVVSPSCSRRGSLQERRGSGRRKASCLLDGL
jgi:hypothetical protein